MFGVINKPLDSLSPRIQLIVLRLPQYQVTLEYIPGKLIFIADTLSRLPQKQFVNTDYLVDIKIQF